MSNSLAIAAVTATLSNLLDNGLNSNGHVAEVTTFPPDKARGSNHSGDQINLFLYHIMVSAAWRNRDIPDSVKPSQVGFPPLSLNLYYMITAYGANDDDTNSHPLLGRAMSIFHDHPLLRSAEIAAILPASELQSQVEHVRITLQPLSLDDMSKIWFMFQTQYRVSAAYEVSVVLIESTRPSTTSLPVLKPNLIVKTFSQPVLETILPQVITIAPAGKPLTQLTLQGQNLKNDVVQVSFGNGLLAPDSVSNKQILVTLPTAPGAILAGVNGVQVVQSFIFGFPLDPKTSLDIVKKNPVQPLPSDPHPGFESNVLPFVLSPVIEQDNAGKFKIVVSQRHVNHDGTLNATVTVTVKPQIGRAQRVVLLLNEFVQGGSSAHVYRFTAPARDLKIDPPTSPTIAIPITGVAVAHHEQYLARIQVDGAESPLIVDLKPQSPNFNRFIEPKVDFQ